MKTIHEWIETYAESGDKGALNEILALLQTEEHLYAALARPTNNFYMGIEHEKPTAYLFTDKQYADDYLREIKWGGIQVKSLEIPPAKRIAFFADLYRSGFELVAIDMGQDSVEIALNRIIDEPDQGQNPEFIINPSLVRAAAQFYQELSRKRAVKPMQDIMCKEIQKARFLLPVELSSLKEGEVPEGKRLVENRPGLVYPVLSAKNGSKFYPIFTDWVEFSKYDKKNQYGTTVVRFDILKRLIRKSDGIALNPFGFNLIMDREKLEAIAEVK